MKLAPCPDCRKNVSIQAAHCVHCGRVFQPEEMEAEAAKERRRRTIAAFVILGVMLFLIIWMAIEGALPR
jgi:predicted nucleic acid-binding Zn ribbon protein